MYSSQWYTNLIKPYFVPPNWIFVPAWTFLYMTIILALILFIVKKSDKSKKLGYIFFIIQLLLNFAWSPVFFLMQNTGFALLILIFLDFFTFLTIKEFYKISIFAGILLIPYQTWILYATYLNFGYFILN